MNTTNNSELPWEDNGQPSPERFYEMAWQNGKNGIKDVEFWKRAFDRYITQTVEQQVREARIEELEAMQGCPPINQ